MGKVTISGSSTPSREVRPALTPEADENQMISLAMDLVKKRLIEGTASSQETTHFLKLASTKARLEKEILEKEKELITAKTEAIKSQKKQEELFERAIEAMKSYSGQTDNESDYEPDDEYY